MHVSPVNWLDGVKQCSKLRANYCLLYFKRVTKPKLKGSSNRRNGDREINWAALSEP